MSETQMRIGQIADRAGVNPKTIRYYEQIGLLSEPTRTASGYRTYTESDAETVLFIKKAQWLGLSLNEIKEIIGLHQDGDCPCGHVKSVLRQHVEMLDWKIAELESLKSKLQVALTESDNLSEATEPAEWCPIIDRGPETPRAPEFSSAQWDLRPGAATVRVVSVDKYSDAQSR